MKIEAPSPWRELTAQAASLGPQADLGSEGHTVDLVVEVDGASEEEVYARAALALGQLQAGGAEPVEGPAALVRRTLEPAGHDRVSQLVALLRDVLALFYDERLILAAIEVRLGPPFAATGWFIPWDPVRHARGRDIKAVCYADAACHPQAPGWRAHLRLSL
jgi:SHS2 domain-containing protein